MTDKLRYPDRKFRNRSYNSRPNNLGGGCGLGRWPKHTGGNVFRGKSKKPVTLPKLAFMEKKDD